MVRIETERLRLRPFTMDDLEALHACIYSSEAVMEYLPGGAGRPISRTEEVLAFFADHWQRHGFGCFAVEDKASGELIGQCGLNLVPDTRRREVEIAFALAEAHWGRGLATEAARAVLCWAFDEIRLDEVIGLAARDNSAGQRVLEKLGMRYSKDQTLYGMKVRRYQIHRSHFNPGGLIYHLYSER
jgi:ribosomal-protein-alanine N-acetyltransferase